MKLPFKAEVEGEYDTDTKTVKFTIKELPCSPKSRSGRRPSKAGKLAALIIADAWAKGNFIEQRLTPSERFALALPGPKNYGCYSGEREIRRAVSNAKKREEALFRAPHRPGVLVVGKIGGVWFSDRATEYSDVIVGYGWCFAPGWKEAVFKIAKAERG